MQTAYVGEILGDAQQLRLSSMQNPMLCFNISTKITQQNLANINKNGNIYRDTTSKNQGFSICGPAYFGFLEVHWQTTNGT